MFPTRFFALFSILLALCLPAKVAAQIFADVTVAGGVNGTLTITLEHVKAPATVANFIGLATGKKGWLDLNTGAIRYEPYYNGIIFHRVIAGFVNQAGSRNGLGTDGPGYDFRDEFGPGLLHDGPYVLSMANSGPHTNGSQFFITAAATSHLDGKHAIFGRVTAGQAISDQINATPVSNQRPITPITIQSINVYGPSLATFNLNQPLLPRLFGARPIFQRAGATASLAHDRLPLSDYVLYDSANLNSWTRRTPLYAYTAPTTDLDVTSTATGPQRFYRLARTDYSTCHNPLIPPAIGSKSFTFTGDFLFVSDVILNAAGNGGTWTLRTSGSGNIINANYTLDPYLPQLFMEWNSTANYGFNLQFRYLLNYTSATGGTYTAQTNVNGYQNISGAFTTSP